VTSPEVTVGAGAGHPLDIRPVALSPFWMVSVNPNGEASGPPAGAVMVKVSVVSLFSGRVVTPNAFVIVCAPAVAARLRSPAASIRARELGARDIKILTFFEVQTEDHPGLGGTGSPLESYPRMG
jgi:hypothetical protein